MAAGDSGSLQSVTFPSSGSTVQLGKKVGRFVKQESEGAPVGANEKVPVVRIMRFFPVLKTEPQGGAGVVSMR